MRRYRQSKYKKVKKGLPKIFFGLAVLLLVIFGLVVYFFFFSSFFKIKNIEINSVLELPEEKIRDIVEKEGGNIFLIDLKATKNMILSEFPQAKEVDLKKKLFASLVVTIEPRIPVGVWCRFEDCFKIDEQGIVYERSQEEGKLIIRTEREVDLGQKAIDYLDVILDINRELDIKEFFISKEQSKLVAKTSGGWDIYFNPQNNISDQLLNLDLVLKEKISSLENLQYIDLRFGNRIFYK